MSDLISIDIDEDGLVAVKDENRDKWSDLDFFNGRTVDYVYENEDKVYFVLKDKEG